MTKKEVDTQEYGLRLVAWMEKEGIRNDGLSKYFLSGASSKEKEAIADLFYDNHRNAHHSEMVHYEPYAEADGSFGYIDKKQGRVVAMAKKLPNGLFSFYGQKEMIPTLFGRGELSTLVDRTADGNYWNKT